MPHCSGVESSLHKHMRELRIQHEGRPYRVLYAFDPRRTAILLIGGDKTGNDRWYEQLSEIAVTFSWLLGAITQCAEKHVFRTFAGERAIRAHNSIADHDAGRKRVGVKGA
jgi:hypothetical protein